MKTFSLQWAFEPFENHPSFVSRRMFGGLSASLYERMVMVLMENPGERVYRGNRYSTDIWNGILLPSEKKYHASLLTEFPSLRPHPVLGKWLYLPADDEDFEETAMRLSQSIAEKDPRLGVPSKSRSSINRAGRK